MNRNFSGRRGRQALHHRVIERQQRLAMIRLTYGETELARFLVADLDLHPRRNLQAGRDRDRRHKLSLLPAEHPGEHHPLGVVLVGLSNPEERRALRLRPGLVGDDAGDRPIVIDDRLGPPDLGRFRRRGRSRLVGRLIPLRNRWNGSQHRKRQRELRQEGFHAAELPIARPEI